MRSEYLRCSCDTAGAFSGTPGVPRQISLPESAETFRPWNASFPLIKSDHRSAGQRKEPEASASHRFHRGSRKGVAEEFLPDGTEGLLLADGAAFSLVSASKISRGGKNGSGTVQPEALYRGRSSPANRDLPRPLARTGTQQASWKARPGSRSRRRRSRKVALHKFRPDDSHGSATSLPALVSLSQKFLRSLSPIAPTCISLHR